MEWICGWFILAIWKALESAKYWKKVNVLCIADQNHERPVVVLDYFRNFKDKLLLEKLKKEKLKIKNLLKISILDEQEPSVQSADRTKAVQVWCLRNMYFPKPAWKVAVSALSENK